MSDAVKALFHPFTLGLLPRPGRAFLLRAEADGLDDDWRPSLACEQSFKPTHDALRARGFTVAPELTGGGFDLGLCLLTKHKLENFSNIGRAWMALRPGGLLACAGANDIGAGSVERAFKAALGGESLSKHRCKVFWAERGDTIPPALAEWIAAGALQQVPETGCWSRPGLYNWNKADDGSALLAEHFPDDLAGRAADLGAGWGYLSLRLLERFPGITSLDLFEAEWHALAAARANLPSPAVTVHWHDVASGLPAESFDVVVTNPPFHRDKATDIDLGRAFVTNAARALVRGGRLLCVANRQLPYEAILEAECRDWRIVAENAVHKVLMGRR